MDRLRAVLERGSVTRVVICVSRAFLSVDQEKKSLLVVYSPLIQFSKVENLFSKEQSPKLTPAKRFYAWYKTSVPMSYLSV